MAAIWNPIWRLIGKKYAMQIVTIGFLAPQNIHLDARIESIAALNRKIIKNVDFKLRPFWKPIWRRIGKKYTMQIVTIGFFAPQNIPLETRIESIATLDPLILENVDFKWRPFWNPIWRLIGKKQYTMQIITLWFLAPKTYIQTPESSQ